MGARNWANLATLAHIVGWAEAVADPQLLNLAQYGEQHARCGFRRRGGKSRQFPARSSEIEAGFRDLSEASGHRGQFEGPESLPLDCAEAKQLNGKTVTINAIV